MNQTTSCYKKYERHGEKYAESPTDFIQNNIFLPYWHDMYRKFVKSVQARNL